MEKLKLTIDAVAAVKLGRIFPKMIKGDALELNAKDVENIGRLLKAASEMRAAQGVFDRTRSQSAVDRKKRTEAAFDDVLKDLIKLTAKEPPKQNNLF